MIDSPGAMTADSGGANAKASIEGGFWFAVAGLVFGVLGFGTALFLIGQVVAMNRELGALRGLSAAAVSTMVQASSDSKLAAERADKAERSAALSREYSVQVYPELNRLGIPVRTPLEQHAGVPDAAYDDHDSFAEIQ